MIRHSGAEPPLIESRRYRLLWLRRILPTWPWPLYRRIAHWAGWDQDWRDYSDVIFASLYVNPNDPADDSGVPWAP